ncbi:MAG: hypothetical protein ABIE74_11615 [Pseudomonadota bacterium]
MKSVGKAAQSFGISLVDSAPLNFDLTKPASIDYSEAAKPASLSYDVALPNETLGMKLSMGQNAQTTYEARQTWIREAKLATLKSLGTVCYKVKATAISEYGSHRIRLRS